MACLVREKDKEQGEADVLESREDVVYRIVNGLCLPARTKWNVLGVAMAENRGCSIHAPFGHTESEMLMVVLLASHSSREMNMSSTYMSYSTSSVMLQGMNANKEAGYVCGF